MNRMNDTFRTGAVDMSHGGGGMFVSGAIQISDHSAQNMFRERNPVGT